MSDEERLNLLHREHQRTVPFENLSIHPGEDIRLDPEALVAKVVDRRRGGFCYELNGAFAALLTALGYRVTLLAARIHGKAGFGPPLDRLALRVDTMHLVPANMTTACRGPGHRKARPRRTLIGSP